MLDRLIPFSPDVYVSLFGRYNGTMWPAFFVALLLGCILIACLRRGRQCTAGLIIATYWIATGWAFHLETYATLNWAALPFGWLFIAQGLLTAGVFSRAETTPPPHKITCVLLALAALLHPGISLALGYPMTTAHLFGISPAATVLIAVAVMLAVHGPGMRWLLVWPIIWSIWDLSSAWTMEIWRDVPLPAIAIMASGYLLIRQNPLRA